MRISKCLMVVPWSQDMEIALALALGFWRTSINPAVVAA